MPRKTNRNKAPLAVVCMTWFPTKGAEEVAHAVSRGDF